jgi:hypothetical protein
MNNNNIIKKKNRMTIEKIINEYIKKICDYDNLNKTFDEKLKNISLSTDNLIDYCIKKKILFFIENKISYTSIVLNFKSHLTKFIKDLVDPNEDIINKYIINIQDDNMSIGKMGWDNVSDLNSIMFNNFKNLNETFEKNVSFEMTNYDEGFDGFRLNDTNNTNYTNDNTNDIPSDITNDNKILPIYIKLLINQNKYLIEFTDKLIIMCNILSDKDYKYKKHNPYN